MIQQLYKRHVIATFIFSMVSLTIYFLFCFVLFVIYFAQLKEWRSPGEIARYRTESSTLSRWLGSWLSESHVWHDRFRADPTIPRAFIAKGAFLLRPVRDIDHVSRWPSFCDRWCAIIRKKQAIKNPSRRGRNGASRSVASVISRIALVERRSATRRKRNGDLRPDPDHVPDHLKSTAYRTTRITTSSTLTISSTKIRLVDILFH